MSQPFGAIGEVDRKTLLGWAYQRRSEASSIYKTMTVHQPRTAVEELIERLRKLEGSLVDEGRDPIKAWDAFIAFLDDYDTGGWTFYLERQAAIDKEIEDEERRLTRQRLAALAATEAVAMRNKYPGGPNVLVGTVIAGLVDVETGRTWIGTSGQTAHTRAAHTVMTNLLKGTVKAEEWPVAACAEVDAMKQYLHDMGIDSADGIPADTLYFHAETWNSSAGKWQGRAACKNCSQWFKKISAQRV